MTAPTGLLLHVVAPAAMITIASQFFRTSSGVIGPELMRELGLSPAALGVANAAFFMSFLVSQIPIGILFDRVGPRRTVSALLVLAVLGALLHATVTSQATLVAARLLIGLGSAGSFMAAVVLSARWYGGERFATMLSRIFAVSNVGYLLAATPWAVLISAVGWRWAFLLTAGVTAVTAVLVWRLTWDAPPAEHDATAARVGETLRGLGEVWRTPGLVPILAMQFVTYGSMLTVLSLWAGPYLHDVHGLDALRRGHVIFAMGAAQIAGVLCYGPLDRRLNTRKGVVVTGGLLSAAVLGALALAPAPSTRFAMAALILFCFVNAFGVVIVAHGQSLFPRHLLGRGVTTVNLAQVVGLTVLPIATGAVVDAFPSEGGASPAVAYRMAFAVLAGSLALGLAVYGFARDVKPREV